MAASEIDAQIDEALENQDGGEEAPASEGAAPDDIDASIDEAVAGLDVFDSPAPAPNASQPKDEPSAADKNVSRTGGRAPTSDEVEIPDDDAIGSLDAELGSGPAKTIKQLRDVVKQLSGLLAHRELLEQIGSLRNALPDIARVGARENRSFARQVNSALDEIAKNGGAKYVGENLSDRRENYASKYKNSIDRLIQEAARVQDNLESQGREVPIDSIIKRLWVNKYASKLGGKPAAKAEAQPAEAPAKKPPAAAVKEQARRGTPGIARTPSVSNQRSAPSVGKAAAGSRIAEFLKSMNN